MEPIKKVLSGGEHPIYLQYGSDDGSAEVAAHDEAEGSQGWSEPHDGLALSSASDEQDLATGSSGKDIGASPRRKLVVALKYKQVRANNRAVRRARNLLGSDLASRGARDRRNGSLESFENFGTDSESIASTSSEDPGLDGDLQVGQAGQQFQDGNEPIPDFNDDSDLDAIVSTDVFMASHRI
jgi:alkanesulfonate monooxygenase SsuD/methylene tetrahydromethanopterin reductase-like flavin-dependent oxidoreductase (luciferase family)